MKYILLAVIAALVSRSPHGERGLKCKARAVIVNGYIVAPLTGSVD